MKRIKKLVGISLILIMTLIASTYTNKIFNGEFALGNSTSTETGSGMGEDDIENCDVGSTGDGGEGVLVETRNTEALLVGFELVPLFENNGEQTLTQLEEGSVEYSMKHRLKSTDRYKTAKYYISSLPVTKAMLSDCKPNEIFSKDVYKDSLSKIIRDYGTYGLFTKSDSDTADIISKYIVGEKSDEFIKTFGGRTDLIKDDGSGALNAIVDTSKDNVDIFTGLAYDPLQFKTSNITRCFVYVPSGIYNTLNTNNVDLLYVGGLYRLVEVAHLREAAVKGTSFSSLFSSYSGSGYQKFGPWNRKVGNTAVLDVINKVQGKKYSSISDITSEFKDISSKAYNKNAVMSATERKKLSEYTSILFPIMIADDSDGKIGGEYTIHTKGGYSAVGPEWIKKLGEQVHTKYVPGNALNDYSLNYLVTSLTNSTNAFSNKSGVTEAFDSCNKDGAFDNIGESGKRAYEYYSKNINDAYNIIDWLVGDLMYSTKVYSSNSYFAVNTWDRKGSNLGNLDDRYTMFMQSADISKYSGSDSNTIKSYATMYAYATGNNSVSSMTDKAKLQEVFNKMTNEELNIVYQLRQWQLQGAMLAIAVEHGMNTDELYKYYSGFNIKYGEVDIFQYSSTYYSNKVNDNGAESTYDLFKDIYETARSRKSYASTLTLNGSAFATTPANMLYLMTEAESADWKLSMANYDLAMANAVGGGVYPVIKTFDDRKAVTYDGKPIEVDGIGTGYMKVGGTLTAAIKRLGCLKFSLDEEGARDMSVTVGIDSEYASSMSDCVATSTSSKQATNMGDFNRRYYAMNLMSRGHKISGCLVARTDFTVGNSIINWGLTQGGLTPFAISGSTYGFGGWATWNEDGTLKDRNLGFKSYPTSTFGGDTTLGILGKLNSSGFTTGPVKTAGLFLSSIDSSALKFYRGAKIETYEIGDYIGRENASVKSQIKLTKGYDLIDGFISEMEGIENYKVADAKKNAALYKPVAGVTGIGHPYHHQETFHGIINGSLMGASSSGSGIGEWYQTNTTWNSALAQKLVCMDSYITNKSAKDLEKAELSYELASATGNIFFYSALIETIEPSGGDINGVLGFDNLDTKDDKTDITHEIFEPLLSAKPEEKPDLVFGIGISGDMYNELKKLADWSIGGAEKDKKPVVNTYKLYYNIVGIDDASGNGTLVNQKTNKATAYVGDWLTSDKGLGLKKVGQLDTVGIGDSAKFKTDKNGGSNIVFDANTYRLAGAIRTDEAFGRQVGGLLAKEIKLADSMTALGIEGVKLAGKDKQIVGTEVVLNDLVLKKPESLKGTAAKSNLTYDIEIARWSYDALFKNQFSDVENDISLQYGTPYNLGMEYYIVVESPDGKSRYLSYFELTEEDKTAGSTATAKTANTNVWNTLVMKKGSKVYNTSIPLPIAGSGWMNGLYRQSYSLATLDNNGAAVSALKMLLYKDGTNWAGFVNTPNASKNSCNSHMWFSVKRNLNFPIEETAVTLFNNGTHKVDAASGLKEGDYVGQKAFAEITVKFKPNDVAVANGGDAGSTKVNAEEEFKNFSESLKSLGIDAIAIFVCNTEDYNAKPDGFATSTVGRFGSDSFVISRDEFLSRIADGKIFKLPLSLVNNKWETILMTNGSVANPESADSKGTLLEYNFNIYYLGIVGGSSLVESKTTETNSGDTKYKEALSSGKVVYDLLTGGKVSTNVEHKDLGYTGKPSDESIEHDCWLSVGAIAPTHEVGIVRSHLSEDDVRAYATIKEGAVDMMRAKPNQNYNVMTGVPSTEKIYFTSGGDEFIYEIMYTYIEQEEAVRTYVSSFAGRECKFRLGDIAQAGGGTTTVATKNSISHAYNNESVIGQLSDTFNIPVPNNPTSAVYTVPAHGGTTITATWKGTIENTTPNPGVVHILAPVDMMGATSDQSPVKVSSSGNGYSYNNTIAPGTWFSGYPGEMADHRQGTKQDLAGSAGGTYSWNVTAYNTALQSAYDWGKAIENASKTPSGNIRTVSNSDHSVRVWHAGEARISINIENVNVTESETDEHVVFAHRGTWTDRVLTTADALKNADNGGGKLKPNEDALSSGWFEVYGSREQFNGGGSCKSSVPENKGRDGRETVSWADETSFNTWLKNQGGDPFRTKDYSYISTWTCTWDSSACPEGAATHSTEKVVVESTYPSVTWCGHNNAVKKDATVVHGSSKTTEVSGPAGCGECPGHGTDESGNANPCTCKHTHYEAGTCTVTAGKPNDGHTCSASHSKGGYYESTTTYAVTLKYTITVTFVDTYLDGYAGTDGTVTRTDCSGGNYPKHSCCGPCCEHYLPAVTDNWVQYVAYNYISIEEISVFKIFRSYVKGINNITYDYDTKVSLDGTIKRGDPNVWYNIGDMNKVYQTIPLYGRKQQASAAGRIRYSVQAQQLDDVVWIERNDKGINIGSYNYNRTGDCDGQSSTTAKGVNGVKITANGHELTYALGIMYGRTYGQKNTANGVAGSIVAKDMKGGLAVNGAVYGGDIRQLNYYIKDKADTALSGTQQAYKYYTGVNGNPSVYTDTPGWLGSISNGGEKKSYSNNWIDTKDLGTLEYARFKERRETPITITVCSDMFIQQTSTGDIPVIFGEKASEVIHCEQHVLGGSAVDVNENITIASHCNRVNDAKTGTKWLGSTRVGGYNGKGNLGGATQIIDIFTSNGYKSYTSVLDAGNNGVYDASIKHTDSKCLNDSVVMTPRITFVAVAAKDNDTAPGNHKSAAVLHQKRMPLSSYLKIGMFDIQLNPVVENGWYKSEIADQTWLPIIDWRDENPPSWVSSVTLSRLFQKSYNNIIKYSVYYKEAKYYDTATKVNDVVIHTPISNTYTYIKNYDGPIEDQRVYDTTVSIDESSYCPGVSSLCKYSYLNCSYGADRVVFSTGFENTARMNVKDENGNTTVADVKVLSVGSDGVTKVTDLIGKLKVSLPENAKIASDSRGQCLYLAPSAGASGTMSIKVSDIDLLHSTGLKYKVRFNYLSDNGSNVLFSSGKFKVYTVAGNYNTLYITDGNGSTYSYTIANANRGSIILDVVVNTDGVSACEVYVSNSRVSGVAVGYCTNAALRSDILGDKIVFGDTSNTSQLYIDNITITRLAGRTTHSNACYDTIVAHERTIQYTCEKPTVISAGTHGAQSFTAPMSGTYIIECYGAQGGGRAMTSSNTSTGNVGGLGGYTKAEVYLNKGQTIYAYVGKQGTSANGGVNAGGGWNGGGNASGTGYGGGGMTYVSYCGTDTQTTGTANTIDTVDVTVLNPAQTVLSKTSGSGNIKLPAGVYYAEVAGELGTSGFFSLTEDTTLYYSVGGTSWLNKANSSSNCMLNSGKKGVDATPNNKHEHTDSCEYNLTNGSLTSFSGSVALEAELCTTGGYCGCGAAWGSSTYAYYPSYYNCKVSVYVDSDGGGSCSNPNYHGGGSFGPNYGGKKTIYVSKRYTCNNLPLNAGGNAAVPAVAGYYSSDIKNGKTGLTVAGSYVKIVKYADLSDLSDITNVEFTASSATISPLSTPSVVLDKTSGSGNVSLQPGIYLLEADGAEGTGGKGGKASGWLLVKNTGTYYWSADGTSWINSSNSSTNAHVLGGKGAVAAAPSVMEYAYTGDIQSVTLQPGTYTLEVWGAQGGNPEHGAGGGLGGYSKGTISLTSSATLYIGVGKSEGSFNGGGYGRSTDGTYGGGATHIALDGGQLATLAANKDAVLIVAGGGGSGGCSGYIGGAGGGANQSGTAGYGSNNFGPGGTGGSLTSTSNAYGTYGAGFGQGGNTSSYDYGSGGGGGGYYGGSAGTNAPGGGASGGGGSGYANTAKLTNISGTTGTNTGDGKAKITGAGTAAVPAVNSSVYGVNKAETKNGVSTTSHVKITKYVDLSGVNTTDIPNDLIDKMISDSGSVAIEKEFIYTGAMQNMLLKPGTYTLEVWGAQGYSYGTNYKGGLGGYGKGTIKITEDTTVYIGVGGAGTSTAGGWNGGGSSSSGYGAGGGATHIALVGDTLGGGSSTIAANVVAGYTASATNRYCWYQASSGCTYTGKYAYSSNSSSFTLHCSGWVRRPQYDYGTNAVSDNDLLLLAGGGGASGHTGNGGAGGGAGTDRSGICGSNCTKYLSGGVGSGGTINFGGLNAGLFYGGNSTSHGGAGGGGYYGGGAGNSCSYGGGGGSGYANTSKLTDTSGAQGVQSENGKAKIYGYERIVEIIPYNSQKVTKVTATCKKTIATNKMNVDMDKVIMVAGGGGGAGSNAAVTANDCYTITSINNLGSVGLHGSYVKESGWVFTKNGGVHIHTGYNGLGSSSINSIWELEIVGKNVDEMTLRFYYYNGSIWVGGGAHLLESKLTEESTKFIFMADTNSANLAACPFNIGNEDAEVTYIKMNKLRSYYNDVSGGDGGVRAETGKLFGLSYEIPVLNASNYEGHDANVSVAGDEIIISPSQHNAVWFNAGVLGLKNGKTYTITFDAYSTISGDILHVDFLPEDLPQKDIRLTATKQTYTWSVTIPANKSAVTYFRVFSSYELTKGYMHISNIKIVENNEASLMGGNAVVGGNAGGGGGGWYGGSLANVNKYVPATRISDPKGTSYSNGFTTITNTASHCCIGDEVSSGFRYVKVSIDGQGLYGKLAGLSICASSYGQSVISSSITDTHAEFVVDKTASGKYNSLSMGFSWHAVGAKISGYTLESSNSKTFSVIANSGGASGGSSTTIDKYVIAGTSEFNDGINYGNGKVVITLANHKHTDSCKNNSNYNYHAHSASCLLGDAASLTALERAVTNARRNNDWYELCTYLGAPNKEALKNIKNGPNNVYDIIINSRDIKATVDSVTEIVKAQSISWIGKMCKIGSNNNPIICCGNKYTSHVCSAKCETSKTFNCTEPHHENSHYAKGNEVCYDACNNDANHVAVGDKIGVSGAEIADRLQLDDYFTLYWDNIGMFYDAAGENKYYTSSDVSTNRGQGYYDKEVSASILDTTRWIRAKAIMFYEVDVLLYNEHTGLWEFHERNVPFYLPVVTDGIVGNGNDDLKRDWKSKSQTGLTEYKFYLLLENNEHKNTEYKVWTLALNDENTTDSKVTPYNIASDILSNENMQNTNKQRASKVGNLAAFETCTNSGEFDVAGSIGNLLITSTTDFRYSNFFKETTDEWLVEPFIKKTNDSVQKRYLGIGIKNDGFGYYLTDVRARPVAAATGYYSTWGTEPWAVSATPFNLVGGDLYSIVTADIRSTYATEDTELVMGYDIFGEITTIGDYNQVDIEQSYYILDTETGKIIDCDVWTKSSEGYKASYISGMSELEYLHVVSEGMDSLTAPKYSLINNAQFEINQKTMSLGKEAANRQVTTEEIARTQRIDNNGRSIVHVDGTVSSALENGLTVSEVLQYIGNIRTITLSSTARTYIGSSYTNILASVKYNPTGTFNGKASTNIGGVLSEDSFAMQARRWLFTLGLPETAYIVPYSAEYEGGKHLNPNVALSDGRDPIHDLLYSTENVLKDRYLVLVAVDIKAHGELWTIEYEAFKQEQQLKVGGKTYKLPTAIPDVIAVLNLSTVPEEDWDIIKSH